MASLLSLPLEIRETCYEFVFGDAQIVTSDRSSKARLQIWRPRNELLQVSQQVRAEALRIYTVALIHFSSWRPELAKLHRAGLSDFMRSSVTFLLLDIEEFYYSRDTSSSPRTQEALNLPNVKEIMVRMDSIVGPLYPLDLSFYPKEHEIQDALKPLRMDPKCEQIMQTVCEHEMWEKIIADICSDTPVDPTSVSLWKQTAICRPGPPTANAPSMPIIVNTMIITWKFGDDRPRARHWRMGYAKRPSSVNEVKEECLTEGDCSICEVLIYEINASRPQDEFSRSDRSIAPQNTALPQP